MYQTSMVHMVYLPKALKYEWNYTNFFPWINRIILIAGLLKHKFHTLITGFPWHGFDQDTHLRERERELTWTWNEAHDRENMYEKDHSGGSNNVSQSPLQCIHAWAWLFCRPHSYKHSIIPVLKIKREQTTLMLMLFHHRSPEYILVYLEQFTWSLFLHIHLSWAATCAGVSLSERVLIILCWWYRHIQPIFLVKTNYMMTRFSIPKIWNFFEFWFCEVETYTKVEYLETLWRVSLITSNHSMPS